MKIFVVIFLLLTVFAKAQISRDEFPKIGFEDMYSWSVNFGGSPPAYIAARGYYYSELRALGLTHIVGFADAIPLGAGGYNTTLKILDARFDWNGQWFRYRGFSPYYFAIATGNSLDFTPYDIGGGYASSLNDRFANYGLGINGKTSWWIHANPLNLIDTSFRDGDIKVYLAAQSDTAHHAGKIMRITSEGVHSVYDSLGKLMNGFAEHPVLYRVGINLRISGNLNNDTVFSIVLKSHRYKPSPVIDYSEMRRRKYSPVTPDTFQLGTIYVRANEYGIAHFNGANTETILQHSASIMVLEKQIFEKDVCFLGYDFSKNLQIIFRGHLKDS